ncbi:AraC-like DNA-binding protein [Litorivivens lipolytica]|uniref:AraC-like DNA-binding protein n=1 Tax=Litorivivens lipolytica TaxID=1524264 RepID=A0A7W4W6Q9_9GAMM|nr:AraC family transcriptional regulator [Litorivivens lipolytica]MBB3048459.1 AraC-like DNA-binding protein [Litorivivens lipolytica]
MSIAALAALIVMAQLALLVAMLLMIAEPAMRVANRLLALILLIIGSSLLLFFWKETGTTPFPGYYRRVVAVTGLAISPLMLLYTRAMVQPGFRLRRGDLLHFVPVALVLIASLPVFGLMTDPEAGVAIATDDSPHLMWLTSLIALLGSAWGLAYVIASLRVVSRYQRGLRDRFSSLEAISLRWLRRILYLFGVMNLVMAPVALLRVEVGGSLHPVLYVILPTAVILLNYVAIAGFRRAQLFYALPELATLLDEKLDKPSTPATAPDTPIQDEVSSDNATKYARSGLDESACRQLWAEVERIMRESKPYLDDSLQLASLAREVGISTQELSQVLSTCAGQNFYDYVNSYRVREVQALMANPDYRESSLLYLAEEAGFRSKSTFNKYFKAAVGQTPGAYRAALLSPETTEK